MRTYSIHLSLTVVIHCMDRVESLRLQRAWQRLLENVCLLFTVIRLVGQVHTDHNRVIYSLLWEHWEHWRTCKRLFGVGDTAVDDVLPLHEWNMRQVVLQLQLAVTHVGAVEPNRHFFSFIITNNVILVMMDIYFTLLQNNLFNKKIRHFWYTMTSSVMSDMCALQIFIIIMSVWSCHLHC